MKNKVRNTILSILTAAVMTTVFTGCKDTETTGDDISSDISISGSITDSDIGGGVIVTRQLYSDEDFDMRYRRWHDRQPGCCQLAEVAA